MKVLALTFLLFATSPIVIDSSTLPPGRTQLIISGSRKVSVERMDRTVTVTVEEGKRVDVVTITHNDDGISFGRRDNGEPRQLVAPGRQPVIVDGIDLEPFMAGNFLGNQQNQKLPEPPRDAPRYDRGDSSPQYYMCPKDSTMVRVAPGRPRKELKCPVDGTPMIAASGDDPKYFLLH